ncbi:cation transporter (plasmid) [Sinorhizobium meliloti]
MTTVTTVRYQVTGMDCSSCAAKIEGAARNAGVQDVKVSIASQIMTLDVDESTQRLPKIEASVQSLGYRLDRLVEVDDDDDKIQISRTCPPPTGGRCGSWCYSTSAMA